MVRLNTILLPSRLYCRRRNFNGSVPGIEAGRRLTLAADNREVADYTAGREFHPALKNQIICK